MQGLMDEIASSAADYAVGRFGQHLPKGKQLALWRRYYDCALASMVTFEEIHRARVIRARAHISEN